MARKFPDDSSGMVYGPDGEPVRRTRAHVRGGFTEQTSAERTWHLGRNEAAIDEESTWLNSGAHFEE